MNYALDVGTRSVICFEHDGKTILRAAVREHAGSFMREGAVIDFEAVASTVREVREEMKLADGTAAAVAIAGANLVTKSRAIKLNGPGPWDESDLRAAEGPESGARAAFEVGGRPVRSVIGMAGAEARYNFITTRLPIESARLKLRAIRAGGFTPVSLVVEPLAVARAVFSHDMPEGRWAIVDIGAGTSDIAILSREGLIAAASLSIAGDSITRAIATKFGLAYIDADRLKRDPKSSVPDMWGESQQIPEADVRAAGNEAASELASRIAAKIAEFGGAPAGVMLVGGGSLWSEVSVRLTEILKAPVRVRNAETIREVVDRTGIVRGPAFLTAIGIMLSDDARRVLTTMLNGREVIVLCDALSVADLMTEAGLEALDFFGEPEEATIDGDEIIGGDPGAPPRVMINGRPADLDSGVMSGDRVTVERGEGSVRPRITRLYEKLGGIQWTVRPTVNGVPATFLTEVREGDRIAW